MSTNFNANITEEQLTKLLRDGFSSGVVKTLVEQLVSDFKRQAISQMTDAEEMIRTQVEQVVRAYAAKSTNIYNDPRSGNLVINIHITKQDSA